MVHSWCLCSQGATLVLPIVVRRSKYRQYFSIRGPAANLCAAHPVATWQWPCHVSWLLFWRLLLSSDHVATQFRHTFCSIGSLGQNSKVLSKFGISHGSFVIVASSGRRHILHEQNANPSSMCLKHEWHWMVLDICLSGFPTSSQIDFASEPSLNFSTTSRIWAILSSSFKITQALVQQLSHPALPVFWSEIPLGLLLSCLDPLSALFPLCAPVSGCEKMHFQKCPANFREQSSGRVEASSVSRIKFVHLFVTL